MSHPTRQECNNCHNLFSRLLTCQKCKLVNYCTKECQVQHWKNGHMEECRVHTTPTPITKNTLTATGDTVFGSLKNAIHYGCNIDEIINIIRTNDIDLKVIANKLILESASAGNETMMWLLLQEDNTKFVKYNVDDEGRNILMLMIIKNRQGLFFNFLETNESNAYGENLANGMLHHCDKQGNNIFHLAIRYKNYDLFQIMLSSDFRTKFLSCIYKFERLEKMPSGVMKKGLHVWKNNDRKTVRDLVLSM